MKWKKFGLVALMVMLCFSFNVDAQRRGKDEGRNRHSRYSHHVTRHTYHHHRYEREHYYRHRNRRTYHRNSVIIVTPPHPRHVPLPPHPRRLPHPPLPPRP